jgi:hypothetical protein
MLLEPALLRLEACAFRSGDLTVLGRVRLLDPVWIAGTTDEVGVTGQQPPSRG